MKAATIEFLRQRFDEYYARAFLPEPSSLKQREWGFVLFSPDFPDVMMRRHIGFADGSDLAGYIRNLVPAHVYYSSAYYQNPDAPTMATKGWSGADLIFDLDADHLMHGPYDLMLARVKEETEKLIGMLTVELGFDPRVIELVFSGGRGYHIHVKDLAVRGFSSAERRELIDYVCGIGIDMGTMLAPSPSPRGWRARYISALSEYLTWLGEIPPEEALASLLALEGVGETYAPLFLKRRPELLAALASGEGINRLDRTVSVVLKALCAAPEGGFLTRLKAKAALADEPVTTDTKRLIRMPGSLHGGSGFRVTPLPVKELPDFDPLLDAVVFGDRGIPVDLPSEKTVPLLGNTYRVGQGVSKVPEAVAVFLCCRGWAEIAGG